MIPYLHPLGKIANLTIKTPFSKPYQVSLLASI
jgi:hypothetical protein